MQQPLPPQIPPTAVNDTLQILFSSAFWAVALIVSIAAVLFFLQDRGSNLISPLSNESG
ncbi:MAG: hypothetical protein M5U34_43370 [Chloroflexi bacterium]|nr:hypothetical protein [Chloroflexota bacterium]